MPRAGLTALVLALLAGTTAAFALTEALKLERSPVTAPRFTRVFSPTCDCRTSVARLALTLREEDTVEAAIVDRDGHHVRVLATGLDRPAGLVRFRWNGRDDRGRVVSDGGYRLRIRLREKERTIVIPNAIRVDTAAPTAALVSVRPRVFSPDGDRRNDRTVVTYRASEASRALLFVDGAPAVRARRGPAGTRSISWGGRIQRRPLPPGRHELVVRVQDRAGNMTATGAARVRIRYIELAREQVRVRRGGTVRFRVLTDARSFSWSLVGRRGRVLAQGSARRAGVAARLPRTVRPGRYVLAVSANGYSDRGLVTVLAARR